ncbi:MAG: hypothetical protein EYC62_05705 [Alphaproteobacteria bacterium]|nr:MAG: hypothetical protein EYC62_05705 [Alphaproteobacteria bacterium]
MVAERRPYSPQLTTAMQQMRKVDERDLRENEILPRLDELFGEIRAGLKSGRHPILLSERFYGIVSHSLAAARMLAMGLWELQAQQERDDILIHGTNEIETPPMRLIFEISTAARNMIEKGYPADLKVREPEATLFANPSDAEIYSKFMLRLDLAYNHQLHQRAGQYLAALIAKRRGGGRCRSLSHAA